jgi:hypothetical protein
MFFPREVRPWLPLSQAIVEPDEWLEGLVENQKECEKFLSIMVISPYTPMDAAAFPYAEAPLLDGLDLIGLARQSRGCEGRHRLCARTGAKG